MFAIETRLLGPLEGTQPLTDYILSNPATGEWATILPEFGGILRQLVLRSGNTRYTLISSPGSAQALLADETYASALMYPFPSRVYQGIYQFEGVAHALPMNETALNNALHGFVHPKPFRVIQQEATPRHALLTIQHDYVGDVPGYPFPFALMVTYVLSETGLTVAFQATNTGTSRCPAAFGWHPYFALNNVPIDELEISIPAKAEVCLDGHMIPTHKQDVPNNQQGMFSLRDTQLDTPWLADFGQADTQGYVTTRLRWPAENLTLEVAQNEAFPYIVIYTPPRRDRIAIEPQTANVNAFNNQENLTILNPGESFGGTMRVGLSE
jgi:aldose 1-epimerase